MDSKISMIKGSSTPEVFCAKLLEGAKDMVRIACVVEYKEGHTAVFSTKMKNVDVAWMRWIFDQNFVPDQDND